MCAIVRAVILIISIGTRGYALHKTTSCQKNLLTEKKYDYWNNLAIVSVTMFTLATLILKDFEITGINTFATDGTFKYRILFSIMEVKLVQ